MNVKSREYADMWRHKANSDLQNAEIILSAAIESPPLDTVCFHCQQAAEKFIKAYLIFHQKPFPFTHNLADLVAVCMQVDLSFAIIQRKAETLTPFAVEIRYPDDFICLPGKRRKKHLRLQKKSKHLFLPKWINNSLFQLNFSERTAVSSLSSLLHH
jgi:HEPN domain-containing protein